MSMFRTSQQSAVNIVDKIMFYGPQYTGKTHTSLTWPKAALVDVETRAAHFADRVNFLHAEPTTVEEIGDVFKEIRSGAIPCDTVIVDSYSAIYEKLVVQHTKKTADGNYVTDYVTVNKRIAGCRDFAFGLARKNIIFIAHAVEKYDRKGNNFTSRGTDILGQPSFRYAFDYIFRLEPTGSDPRVSPPKFYVEKSASPNLKIGQVITGLDYMKFRQLTASKSVQAASVSTPPQPANIVALLGDIDPGEYRRVTSLAQSQGVPAQRLALLIASITGDIIEPLTAKEVPQLVDMLKAERTVVTA